jgi:hypothetical protein
MKITSILRVLSMVIPVVSFCLLSSAQAPLAQEENLLPEVEEAQLDKAPVVSMKKDTSSVLREFTGSEVFYRPTESWGLKLDLAGFHNLNSKVSGMTIVGFGVREDSVGLTLAHLYVNSFGKFDSVTTAKFYAGRLFKSLESDTTVVLGTLSRKVMYGFETVEFDRVEVWPQPDPNNPGKMFDSTLVRRHFNAITTYRNSWIDLHLSKTEYRPADSAIFTDLLRTFEITENFERKKVKAVEFKLKKKP